MLYLDMALFMLFLLKSFWSLLILFINSFPQIAITYLTIFFYLFLSVCDIHCTNISMLAVSQFNEELYFLNLFLPVLQTGSFQLIYFQVHWIFLLSFQVYFWAHLVGDGSKSRWEGLRLSPFFFGGPAILHE